MANSTARRQEPKARKKKKPDAPPFKHATGRWAKKVNGKLVYLGYVRDDPEGDMARHLWQTQGDNLRKGYKLERTDRGTTTTNAPTVALACNSFLTHTEDLIPSGERTARTLADYVKVSKRIALVFGRDRLVSTLTPADFAKLRGSFARTHGPYALSGDVARVRAIFTWAARNRKLPEPDYGSSFDKPEVETLRRAFNAGGPRMFERWQLWSMLYGATIAGKQVEGASQPLRSMILLAINAGLGNADLGRMPITSINLRTGWLDFPRPKTGIARRVPLWPETVESIADWLSVRPAGNTDLLFVTRAGGSWFKEKIEDNPISKEFAKLLKRLGLHKRGCGFYDLRRTHRTIASDSRDEAAADAIMGHAPNANDMAARYRQRVGDDRLQAVVDHVRGWLWPRPTVG